MVHYRVSPQNGNRFETVHNFFINTNKCKIFKTIVVLLNLILNMTTILLVGSSTGSDVITNM